ncbi:peptide chain release factor N(5)-glutamine methyltransferase [Arhodomonas aquaeolei]|uniref:peptide chain release factor N(5)-glutamine methyltransferase n=1 Tax=Arhodomonas aquaeolei TaxID=2369 RepID=UPI002169042E|nr:peptide chain release factor N(5)-glutamine methyltransferase [Arhodomonas aquaeolei]MCS4504102.1 peptide chain release factor N(5)-glutamine methyltransferase [Arhodomonas aquaeolei]
MADHPPIAEDATVTGLLAEGRRRLAGGDSPGLDAALLLAHALGRSRTWLHTWPEHSPGASEVEHFRALLAARARGAPIAHLTGEREFWSLALTVTPDTLVPRPETETLVEAALAVCPAPPERLLDLGTGSGAVALALASEWPGTAVDATERSHDAATLARENAARLGLDARVSVFEGDWFAPLPARRYPLVVSNPPYIGAEEPEPWQGDAAHEPRGALIAADAGLAALCTIVDDAPDWLAPGGWLILEHGWRQGEAVRGLLADAGYTAVRTWRDLAGHERVTGGRRP